MALPAYPNIAYKPDPPSWSIAPAVPPIQSDMGGGNVRRRAIPGSNSRIITQTVTMPFADWDTLKTFCDVTLGFCASRFTMSIWLGSAFATMTVQFMDDFPKLKWWAFTHVAVDMKLMVFDA